MLLELEKRRGPRALLLRRPPRHATPRLVTTRRGLRDWAEPSSHLRAYFCQSLTESFLTAGPRSETSDRGLSRTRTWVEPTSLHAAAAAGDSIPSATYTVDGRAGLRNHALLVPVRGEGRIGFWAAITRLLASDRLLPLRPRRLHYHHVHRRRPCRRRESWSRQEGRRGRRCCHQSRGLCVAYWRV